MRSPGRILITVILCLAVTIPVLNAAIPDSLASKSNPTDNMGEVIRLAEAMFPGTTIRIEMPILNRPSDAGIGRETPEIRQMRALLAQMEASLVSKKTGNVPYFSFGMNEQAYESYDRYAEIYSHVPVAWDNDNPQQVDINLPNGGHGLIWIPQPTEYAWRYIGVHASTAYLSRTTNTTMGVYYEFPSGTTLNLMNMTLGYKHEPKNYGFPWSSTLSNSVTMPLMDLIDGRYTSRNVDIANQEGQVALTRLQLEQAEEQRWMNRLSGLLSIHNLWRQLDMVQALLEITGQQVTDLDLLFEKKKISVFDKVSIESEYQSLTAERETLYHSILLANAQLNPPGSEFVVTRPAVPDLDSLITTLEQGLPLGLTEPLVNSTVDSMVAVQSAAFGLQNALNSLKMVERLHRPSLDFSLSIDLFQSNDLGYDEAAKALLNSLSDPDGVSYSAGIQYRIPLTFLSRNREVEAAEQNYRVQQSYKEQVEEQMRDQWQQQRIAVLSARAAMKTQEASTRTSRRQFADISELYTLRRIAQIDYQTYQKEYYRSEYLFVNARLQYTAALLQYRAFLGKSL